MSARRGGRAARLATVEARRRAAGRPPADATPAPGRGAPGPAPDGAPERVLVLACGALAHEIRALIEAHRWDHLTLHCLPAVLHNHPDRIPAAVEAAHAEHAGRFDRVFVAYADCGTGGRLAALCERLGVQMIAGPHCYAFYQGLASWEGEGTAFYLTDFLARQFDALVWRPLGLDRHPELRDAYFGGYTTLVHQAQTDDPALEALARGHADRLGLAFERRLTGHGDLADALADLRPAEA